MPEDQAPDSIDSIEQSIPDITPSRSDSPSNKQFSGIRTRAQLKKSNSQLVQIRSDHGPVQMEKQCTLCAMIAMDNNDKPNVNDALSGPDAGQWRSAMDDEVAQLRNLDTFELVPLPADQKIIGCQWVLAMKRDTNGQIIKYKA